MGDETVKKAVDSAKERGLLTSRQVADEYGIAPQTLANYRWQGTGPRYIKLAKAGRGAIKYRRADVEAWLDAHTVTTGGA